MAAPGGVVNETRVVHQPADRVMNQLLASTAGVSGYSLNTAGSNSLILVRRYWPTWVIVVAVLGTLFFLLGLVALVIRETETLTISLSEDAEGTRIDVSGVASSEMQSRLRASLDGLGAGEPRQLSSAEKEADPASDDRTPAGDKKVCPDCAETVKAGARVCRYCGHQFVSEAPQRVPDE
jgi:hypothetical protein